MLVVGARYCVQLLPGVTNFQTFLLPSPLLKRFSFIFCNSQECPVPQDIIWCPIKTQLTKTAFNQLFKGVAHEEPWSSIVCLFWGPTIVSSFFFEVCLFQNHSLLSLSFPLLILFFFYFLSSILLEFSKCLISQNTGCLIKTQLRNSSHFFSRP